MRFIWIEDALVSLGLSLVAMCSAKVAFLVSGVLVVFAVAVYWYWYCGSRRRPDGHYFWKFFRRPGPRLFGLIVLCSPLFLFFFREGEAKEQPYVDPSNKSERSSYYPPLKSTEFAYPPERSVKVHFGLGSYELTENNVLELENYARKWLVVAKREGGIIELVAVGGADEVRDTSKIVAFYEGDPCRVEVDYYMNGQLKGAREFAPAAMRELTNKELGAARALVVAQVFQKIIGPENVTIRYKSHEMPDMKDVQYRMGYLQINAIKEK